MEELINKLIRQNDDTKEGEKIIYRVLSKLENNNELKWELLEALYEYSSYFRKIGLTLEEATEILLLGKNKGLGYIDRMGDVLKEFCIRTTIENAELKEALEIMKLDAEETKEKLLQGGNISKTTFKEIINKLDCIQDVKIKNKVGEKIFRTFWEEMKDLIVKLK